MPATIAKIASHARVSPALVSRFINQDPDLRITDEKRERILKSAQKLGGLPEGRGIKRWKHHLTYRVVVPFNEEFSTLSDVQIPEHSVTLRMQTALLKALKAEGFRLELTFYDEQRKIEDFIRLLDSPPVCDGLMLYHGAANDEVAELLLARRFPHVSVDANDERKGLNTLLVSETDVLDEAMAHLLSLGHQRIAYLGPSTYYRYAQIVRAIAQAGVELREDRHCFLPDSHENNSWAKDRGHSVAAEHFGRWLDAGPNATAVLCSSDHVMVGAIEAMRERGLEPGRDLSLIGYNNMEQRTNEVSTKPVLTTIDHPADRMGERCAKSLLAQIERRQTDIAHERVPTRLILRQTTGPCPKH